MTSKGSKMAKNSYKGTDVYIVVTYGPEGTWSQPWYLKKNPKRKPRKNEDLLACHYFTGYLSEEAEFFNTPRMAEVGAENIREIFAKRGHVLANTFKVATLGVKLV